MVKRIIIAENDEAARMAHRDMIHILAPDAVVDEVTDGDDLVRKVTPPSNYDLIITGRIDAFEEIRRLNPQIPIYLVSNMVEEGERDYLGTSIAARKREREILQEYLV